MNGSAATSQAYSNNDDYIISYVFTPMVHMIARRRPALSLSNIALMSCLMIILIS